MTKIWAKLSKTLKYQKVSRIDEFENVTGIINLYQLFINLYNTEISLEISFEKLT